MKPRSYWLPAILLVAVLAGQTHGQQMIRWEQDLPTAQRIASQTNRLVLIQLWAPWCGACRKLEREVLERPDVAAAIEANYVPVKLNADYFRSVGMQYGVTALPTVVITTPDGQRVENLQGAVEAPVFIANINRIASTARGPAAPEQTPYGAVADARKSNPQTPPTAPSVAPPGYPPPGTPSAPAVNPYVGPRYAAQGPWGAARPAATTAGNVGPLAMQGAPTTPPAIGPIGMSAPPIAPALMAGGPAMPGAAPSAALAASPATSGPSLSPGAPASPSALPTTADGNFPLGLDGYCPVQLTENRRWVMGDRRWGVNHEGRLYLFAGPEEQKRFLDNPRLYGPVISGNDVVMVLEKGQAMAGRREHGVFFGQRIYLFASEESLQEFSKRPNYYANAILHTQQAVQQGQMYR